MLHRPAFLALFAYLAFGGTALAQGAAQRDAAPKVVVELFTSQGCASCPPADALLTELAKDPQVIALTLAVDYWDYIGWKDTLALHGHSLRQKAYAEQRPDRKVFTPQMVVDGVRSAKGSDRAAVQRALLSEKGPAATPKVLVTLERSGDAIEVDLADARATVSEASVWACPVARNRSVAIGRGENGGRNATYSNVVRGWVKVGTWDGRGTRLTVPLAELRRPDADMLAVLVQEGSLTEPGRIIGAAMMPLD